MKTNRNNKKSYIYHVYRNDGRFHLDFDTLKEAKQSVKEMADPSQPFTYGIQKIAYVQGEVGPCEVSRQTLRFA